MSDYGKYSRINKITTTRHGRGIKSTYDIVFKDGIRRLDESELEDILNVIKETIRESFQEGYEAQDILLIEGEKPEVKVKGRRLVLEQCREWELEHFNYFLFNMSMLSTKNRNGEYFLGKEDIYRDEKGAFKDTTVEKMRDTTDIRSPKFLNKYGNRLMDMEFFQDLMREHQGSYDYSLTMDQNILRCHVYSVFGTGLRQEKVGLSIRVVPQQIPKLDSLNLPKKLLDITDKNGGLFLVSGRTGDGKSTTVASIINRFNHDQEKRRVITVIEDPIEFIHKSLNAKIIQRRLGGNVPSYGRATEDSLRESTDIVVLGELRNKEEIVNALRLAEVGKMVIATIHANSVADTVDRFVGEFSNEQDQYRSRLLENLLGILHQNLIVFKGEQFPLSSMIMFDTEGMRKILRDKKFTRSSISDVLHQDEYSEWAISQKQWFREQLEHAEEVKKRVEGGENVEELPNHERKLLLLLEDVELAREKILGENGIDIEADREVGRMF